MWCKYVCPCVYDVVRRDVYLYTSVKPPIGKEGVECEIWAIGTNSETLGGKEYTRGKRTSKRLSLPLDRGHERHIREVPQEDGHSRKYRAIFFQCVNCMLLWLSCVLELSTILIVVYFHRLKNKQWLSWVYSWIWHRCEHLYMIGCIFPLQVKNKQHDWVCKCAFNLEHRCEHLWVTK
jgi:hypothetical protein